MSDTPKTDAVLIAWDFSPEPKLLTEHARELERELNKANARVKELEDERDKAVSRYEYVRKMNGSQFCALLQDCLFTDLRFDDEIDRRTKETTK